MKKEQVLDYLIHLFPGFSELWSSKDNLFTYEDGSYTYHGLFSEFSQFFKDNFSSFSDEQLMDLFARVEKWEVKETARIGDKPTEAQQLSNAVFTCFLEYIAGEGFTARLKPFMGKKSLEYYTHYDH